MRRSIGGGFIAERVKWQVLGKNSWLDVPPTGRSGAGCRGRERSERGVGGGVGGGVGCGDGGGRVVLLFVVQRVGASNTPPSCTSSLPTSPAHVGGVIVMGIMLECKLGGIEGKTCKCKKSLTSVRTTYGSK